ncbi:unnamed protein product [Closterium sp. NIES-65]|nr:unnamed protein product [Closterium sp. NIES-65]
MRRRRQRRRGGGKKKGGGGSDGVSRRRGGCDALAAVGSAGEEGAITAEGGKSGDGVGRAKEVGVTHVLQMVDSTRLTLRNRYPSDADDFGEGSNELSAFLAKHASSEKRVVKVTGTDSTGAPTTHEYTLHEQKIKGQKSGGGLDDCITLAKGYVKELLKRLESRMKDLGSLEGAKLFTQGAAV